MKVTYDKGVFAFDFAALMDGMPDGDKRALADHLACEDAIIDDVASQIVTGWTEAGSHGSKYAAVGPDPTTGLEKAWRDVAKASGDTAKTTIENLENSLREAKLEIIGLQTELRETLRRYA